MDPGPLYLRLTAVVLGTLALFAATVVAIHAVALGRATGPLRLQAAGMAADLAARDLAAGRQPGLPPAFGFSLVTPEGRLAGGPQLPPRLRLGANLDTRPGEHCAAHSGPCYAVRALPGRNERLVAYPRRHVGSELIGPLSVALVGSVLAWLLVSAGAGLVLLRSLRRADEGRRRLLAGLAHDLGTPLTSIRGFAETLLATPDAEPPPAESQRRGWIVVYREALRMQRLVEDLLTVTRLEAGRLSLVPRAFELRALLEAAAERARLAHGRAPLLDLPRGPVEVRLDRDRLEQLLANLVDNAYRHGGGSPVRLELRDGPRSDTLEIVVADEGPGLSEAARTRLFQPFQPGPAGGSGLGLHVARELARRHGGDLEILGPPGCRARLLLPRAAGAVR